MSRNFRIWGLLMAVAAGLPASGAEPDSTTGELKKLRAVVEEQTRQIEALTQQVARLIPVAAAPAPSAAPAEPPPPAAEPPKAEPVAPAKPAPAPATPAVVEGPKHIVVKGETLTSIAKHYNIPLLDLQKANKIEDGRKLQIGQTLSIPNARSPETSTEKKENP